MRVIGRMVLDRNPDNFFAETEQAAFLPSNVVPGIDFTDDPLLQGRLFSYLDTQKSRLGTTNFHQIPINAPKCPFANMQRDGLMQTQVPKGRANYEPNSLNEAGENPGPRPVSSGYRTAEQPVEGEKLRIRPESFGDFYSQPRMYWNSMTGNEQAHIASAIVFELSKVSMDHIRERMLGHLQVVHPDLGKRVADGLGMNLPKPAKPFKQPIDLPPSDALSIQKNWPDTLEGRQVAILFDEGSSKSDIEALKKAVEAAKGTVFTIAPKVGGLSLKGGTMKADGQLAGSPSVLFDAVALVLTTEAAAKLAKDSSAVAFVSDAFAHLKAIGATEGAKALMDRAGVAPDDGVTDLNGLPEAAKLRYWDREPKVRDLA